MNLLLSFFIWHMISLWFWLCRLMTRQIQPWLGSLIWFVPCSFAKSSYDVVFRKIEPFNTILLSLFLLVIEKPSNTFSSIVFNLYKQLLHQYYLWVQSHCDIDYTRNSHSGSSSGEQGFANLDSWQCSSTFCGSVHH